MVTPVLPPVLDISPLQTCVDLDLPSVSGVLVFIYLTVSPNPSKIASTVRQPSPLLKLQFQLTTNGQDVLLRQSD
jgi:hypothetical protein